MPPPVESATPRPDRHPVRQQSSLPLRKGRLSRREIAEGRGLIDVAFPATRGDCPSYRPCPHVRCRYHLAVDVSLVGTLILNHPGDVRPQRARRDGIRISLDPLHEGTRWWDAAAARLDVPPTLGPLLDGDRPHVWATWADAVGLRAWCAVLPGWGGHGDHPVRFDQGGRWDPADTTDAVAEHLASGGLPQTCALDVAHEGPHTLQQIGDLIGLTRERVRQIVRDVAQKLTSTTTFGELDPDFGFGRLGDRG